MIEFTLRELAQALPGRQVGEDATVRHLASDTRCLSAGSCFVALSGPRFDGHDYLEVAAEKGAAAALVRRGKQAPMPCVQVDDTRLALGRLATLWRRRSSARVVGITGSNGKTTVKEMLAGILALEAPTLATQGNLNNDIGLPLTLCRLQDEQYAVVEMGANHPGEIAYLSGLAQPDIAILNNAGPAHLEGFGDVAGVARAKAEILQGLSPQGVFIYNHDDEYAALWKELARGYTTLSFGRRPGADVFSPADTWRTRWTDQGFHSEFMVDTPEGRFQVQLPLAGDHNHTNALAAIAAALQLGLSKTTVARGLAAMQPVAGRLQQKLGPNGMRILDDSYNANPASVRRAIELLVTAPGRRVMILGDLGELGNQALDLHAQLGTFADRLGVDLLLTCGRLSAATAERFNGESRHFDQQQRLIDYALEHLGAEDTVLIKGSRSAQMEKVVQALCAGDTVC